MELIETERGVIRLEQNVIKDTLDECLLTASRTEQLFDNVGPYTDGMASDIKLEQDAHQNEDKVGINTKSNKKRFSCIVHATDRGKGSGYVVKTEPGLEYDGPLSVHIDEAEQQQEYNKDCTTEIKVEPQVELDKNTIDESVFEIEKDFVSEFCCFTKIGTKPQLQCTDMKKYSNIVHVTDREENSRDVAKTEPDPDCDDTISIHVKEAELQDKCNENCMNKIKKEPQVEWDDNIIDESVIEIENGVFSEFCGLTEMETEPQVQYTRSNLKRHVLDGEQNTYYNGNSRDTVKTNGPGDCCESDYRLECNENSVMSDTGHTSAQCVPRKGIENAEDAQNAQNRNTVYKKYSSCGRCGIKYSFDGHLQAHKKKCKGSSNVCFVCGNSCSSLADFYLHISVHSEEEHFNTKEGHSHKQNEIEMETERLRNVEKTNKTTGSFSKDSHVNSSKIDEESNTYQRNYILDKETVAQRKITEGQNVNNNSCVHKRQTSQACNLQAHKKQSYEPKTLPCVCSVCGRVYDTLAALTHHLPMHSGEKTHVCTDCRIGFSSQIDLKNHQESHNVKQMYKYCGQKRTLINQIGPGTYKIRLLNQNIRKCDIEKTNKQRDANKMINPASQGNVDQMRVSILDGATNEKTDGTNTNKFVAKKIHYVSLLHNKHFSGNRHTPELRLPNQSKDKPDLENTNRKGDVNKTINPESQDVSQQNYFCFDCKVHFNYRDNINKHKLHHNFKDVNLQFKGKTPQMRVSILNDASNENIDDTSCNNYMAVKEIENTNKEAAVNKMLNPISQGD